MTRDIGSSAGRSDALLSRLQLFGMRLGLDRIRRLLDALDRPHLAVPVVLVAGTNGKGSTAALLASISQAAGYRTGLYTSPHLESPTERLAINQRPIPDRQLAEYLDRAIESAANLGSEPPTYFEALTVAAFLYFRDQNADLSIMEVGLGGRLDATNVSEPILSLITSISLDHEAHLGDSLEAIAGEKCGIMRRGTPVIAWPETPALESLLQQIASDKGAPLVLANVSDTSAPGRSNADGQHLQLQTQRQLYDLKLYLPGAHQARNTCLAVCAAEVLAANGWPAFDARAITTGIAKCRWPGRLEWIHLGDGRRVLLDVAHNRAGIEALVSYVSGLDHRPSLLFGALEEKTIDATLPRLSEAVGSVVLTRPRNTRAAHPERWRPFFTNSTTLEPDPSRALELALDQTDNTLLVCGSTYLVGEIRRLLRERAG